MSHWKTSPHWYSNALPSSWTRALSSLIDEIDEGLAAMCMQQWQRAPIAVARQDKVEVKPHEAR